jgi:ADP-ribose pyrophosphatase YjhB (NUDIX family)
MRRGSTGGDMNFCSQCGSGIVLQAQHGDKAPRYRCPACAAVFYLSPRLTVACIAAREDRIVLCRRAAAPGYGLWTLPSGFVEQGEPASRGAARETMEEAQAEVELIRPYALFHISHENQLQVVYLARLLGVECKAGVETLEARLFSEAEIPWGALAFTTTQVALRKYFEDFRAGSFGFHFADIVAFSGGSKFR